MHRIRPGQGTAIAFSSGVLGMALASNAGLAWVDAPMLRLVACLALPAVLLLGCAQRQQWLMRGLGLALLGSAWFAVSLLLALAGRLDPALAGQQWWLEGQVCGLPQRRGDWQRFCLQPLRADGTHAGLLPERLLVTWYRNEVPVGAGEQWRLRLQLRPTRGRLNFIGHDPERWALVHGYGGRATVREGRRLQPAVGMTGAVHRARAALGEKVARAVVQPVAGASVQSQSRWQAGTAEAALLRALLVGDRSQLEATQWQYFRATGTAHLVAISGMHVGLLAASLVLLLRGARRLCCLLLKRMPSRLWELFPVLALSLAYCALAGFALPTTRAWLMLLAWLLVASLRRPLRAGHSLCWALCAILLLQPLAPLEAGFWLSFGAVACLLLGLSRRRLQDGGTDTEPAWWSRSGLGLLGWGRAQWVVLLGLMPLGLFYFGLLTPAGLLANAIAIPLVGMALLPLLMLATLCLALDPGLADGLLRLAGVLAGLLLAWLEWLAATLPALEHRPRPGAAALLLALLGAVVFLLPRGWPARWLGAVLLLPLLWPPASRLDPGGWQLHLLDGGQGLAAVLDTTRHSLLYDTGPGDGHGRDLVRQVIAPAMGQAGRLGPDRVVVSHGDLDHAGGLGSLYERHPDTSFLVSLPAEGTAVPWRACRRGQGWRWDNVDFDVLHPGTGLPYLGNDSSCVLRITGTNASLLLTGDISQAVEQHLAQVLGREQLAVDLLLVPHHGSASSSSIEFVQAVAPALALNASGYLNHFGLPRAEVVARYRNAAVPLLDTGRCGAILVRTQPDGSLGVDWARRRRAAAWRAPEPGCLAAWAGPGLAKTGAGDWFIMPRKATDTSASHQ